MCEKLKLENINSDVRCFVIDAADQEVNDCVLRLSFNVFRDTVKSGSIDVTTVKVCGFDYAVVYNMNRFGRVSAIGRDGSPWFLGNVVFMGMDDLVDGYRIRSLADEEVRILLMHLKLVEVDTGFKALCMTDVSEGRF